MVHDIDTPRDSIACSEESGVPLAPPKAGRLVLSSRAKVGMAIATVVGLGMVGSTIYAVGPECTAATATLAGCIEASPAEGDAISPHLTSPHNQQGTPCEKDFTKGFGGLVKFKCGLRPGEPGLRFRLVLLQADPDWCVH